MIFLLSPAKTLDYDTVYPELTPTIPAFLEHSKELINELKKLSADEVGGLMHLSEKLSILNHDRYHSWTLEHTAGPDCRPALLAFKGDVYQGLDAPSWTEEDFTYAQSHLRILSGLYGLMKPLDLLQPYRLEMGTKLANARGKNLYEFWGSIITEALTTDLGSEDVIVNLASNEYFSSIKKKELQNPVITPVFKDYKNGKYKIISFYAKKARGTMAAWAIKNKVSMIEDLKTFHEDGYLYNELESTETEIVFLRNIEGS